MATYVNIPAEEMAAYLSPMGFQAMECDGTVELVYGVRVDRDDMPLSLRIYTGINPNGQSREVGKDAIRVQVMWRDGGGEVHRVGGSKRVHRVAGWRKNLLARLEAWEEAIRGRCPRCGAPKVARKNKKGEEFTSCVMWPKTKCPGR